MDLLKEECHCGGPLGSKVFPYSQLMLAALFMLHVSCVLAAPTTMPAARCPLPTAMLFAAQHLLPAATPPCHWGNLTLQNCRPKYTLSFINCRDPDVFSQSQKPNECKGKAPVFQIHSHLWGLKQNVT